MKRLMILFAFCGVLNLRFSNFVSIWNNALSPLERIMAKPLLSTPLSYNIPDRIFSVSASFALA